MKNKNLSRRFFLKSVIRGGACGFAFGIIKGIPLALPTIEAQELPKGTTRVVVCRGKGVDPKEITRRAIAALGGMEQFVKKGADVIIKPNICNAFRDPEHASTTNPDVVGEVVRECVAAGAKRVRVMDFPFGGSPQDAYERSGIRKAVEEAGGVMEVMSSFKFKDTPIPNGKDIKSWQIYEDILKADVVINIPIAKHHRLAGLTLAIKNLLGVVQNRPGMHPNMAQRLADLATVVKPTLTIIDAIRILVDNGPTGGRLEDVKREDTVIVSTDMVAADAYATTLFGKKPSDIGYIIRAAEMGLGKANLDEIKIEEINIV